MFVRAVLGAAAVLFSATSVAASAPPKQPTDNWVVDFADAQCVAKRNYRTESNPLWFVLKQPPIGNSMQLSIIDQRSASRPTTELDGTIEFDGQPPLRVRILRFGSVKLKLRSLMTNLTADQFSSARSASTLRFRTEGFDETFALADVEPLLKVMNDCVADLRRTWNVKGSEEEESEIRDDAKGDLRFLFKSEDYPTQALRRDEDGTVSIALLVDERGRVADCSIKQTSRVAALDAQTCAVMKERARFTPAVGTDGKPRKGAFIQRITWRLQ